MRQGLAIAIERRARGFEFVRFSRLRPGARAFARGTDEESPERAVAVRVLRLAERVVARVRVVERDWRRRALLRTAFVCVELFELQVAPLSFQMTADVRGDLTENVRPHLTRVETVRSSFSPPPRRLFSRRTMSATNHVKA